MQVIVPKTIVDAVLISSSVAEDDHPAYNAGTTYASGQYCMVQALHRIYKSLVDNNLGKYPPDNTAGTNPAWLEIGYTNRWRMFDPYVGTLTTNADSLQVVLDSSRCDSLAVFNAIGSTALVELLVSAAVVWSQEVRIIQETAGSWFDYFFGEIVMKNDFSVQFPIYGAGSQIRLTITGAEASCGNVVIGRRKYVGNTLFEPTIGIKDFSRKVTDENFGNTYLKQGAFSKRCEVAVEVETSRVDYVFNSLAALRATPAVYICDNEGPATWTSLLVYGFYRDYNIVIPDPVAAKCNVEIEGLI